MKRSEFEKILLTQGYVFKRHGGRHDIYEHRDTGKSVAVPRHWGKELKGLEKTLLKEIGYKG